ncbi:MAG: DUF5715 family protein [Pyrinomonadaceae bacterium]
MKLRKTSLIFLTGNLIFFIVVAALLVAPVWKRRGSGNLRSMANLLAGTVHAAEVNPWTLAVEKIKEDRGEPTGKQAKVEIPAQLQHYSDTGRFLATQVAEVKEHQIETPQDFVGLAALITRGELVQLNPVAENYLLFGVGGNANNQPFTRYENGKRISLYNEARLRQEYDRLAESQAKLVNEIAGLKQQVAGLTRLKSRQRSQRTALQTQITVAEKALKLGREDKAQLDSYYENGQTRQQLFADYESLEKLALEKLGKPTGKAFDLGNANARQQMKVRMLSSLRPEALKVLEEVAASYREKFNRPLPITSLVRPDEYQLELSKTNPNATRIETPPHSTGLAFDILYRYMTAAEQSHVMSDLARLKDEGRIEVLRENRDHYHVFAFVDGLRPHEEFIAASLGTARSAKVAGAAIATNSVKARPTRVAATRSAKPAREAHHSRKNTVTKSRAKVTKFKAKKARR